MAGQTHGDAHGDGEVATVEPAGTADLTEEDETSTALALVENVTAVLASLDELGRHYERRADADVRSDMTHSAQMSQSARAFLVRNRTQAPRQMLQEVQQ